MHLTLYSAYHSWKGINSCVFYYRVTNTLTVPTTSIYFIHLNAGARSGQRVNLSLRGGINADIFRNSTTHNGIDTISRDIIQTVNAGASITVVNEHTGQLFSDAGRQTSFTAFDLQAMTLPGHLEVFSVARQSGYEGSGAIPFDDILVDTGANYWNGANYMIQTTGIYLFTLSCGAKPGVSANIKIRTSSRILGEITRTSTSHNAEDTMSITLMGTLYAGDYVYADLSSGSIYSDSERQTYFGGFHYHPVEGSQHAWSVNRTRPFASGVDPVDPFPFEGAEVNIPTDLYSFTDHHVHISQSGLYYVHLTVGVYTGNNLEAFIVRDISKTEAEITRSSTSHNGVDMASQGLLIELSAGNTLKVVLGASSYLSSSGDPETVFTGMLLYPYPN